MKIPNLILGKCKKNEDWIKFNPQYHLPKCGEKKSVGCRNTAFAILVTAFSNSPQHVENTSL